MSDKKESTAPAAASAKKKSGGKLFLIVGIVVLLLGGGGLAAYFTMRAPAEGAAAPAEEKPHAAVAGTGLIGFEPFVVNLADAGAKRFLRISVRLIVGDEEEAKHIEESEVQLMRLRSAIVELLTEQTSDHVSSPEGKAELKRTIAERAAAIVAPIEVSDVLFSDLVVQY